MILTSFIAGIAFALLFYHHIPTPVIILFVLLIFCSGLVHRKSHHAHDGFLSADYFAQQTDGIQIHTGIKLATSLASVFICISCNSPATCFFVAVIMSAYTLALGKIPISYYLSALKIPLLFISLSCITVAAEFSAKPLGYLDIVFGDMYICATPGSQYTAILLFAKAAAGISCLLMIGITTKLSLIIGFMKIVRIPKIIIELMYLIYRYIFVVFNIQNTMSRACDSRLGYSSQRRTMKTSVLIASNLLVLSFKLASDNFDAMEARCYDGNLCFYQEEEPFKIHHLIICTLFITSLITMQIIKI